MTLYITSENEKPINELYAVIQKDSKGNEGMVAYINLGIVAYPLVSGDDNKINQFKEIAKQIKKDTGVKLYICKFTNKEIIEEI